MKVLITGANKGLGKAVAEALAKKGLTVVLGVRDLIKGRAVLEEFFQEGIGENAHLLKLDMQDIETLAHAREEIERMIGGLDVLVNNAGVYLSSAGAMSVSSDEIEETMQINFLGPWRLMQEMYPLLCRSTNARVINVSSGMGELANRSGGYAAYRVSKAALNALTVFSSNDIAREGIKVVAVCPGWVRTDMGGSGATRDIDEGAAGIIWSVLSEEIESGCFYRDGKKIGFP